MKKLSYYYCVLLIGALACAGFLASGTSSAATREQPGTNPGRLIIYRAANLGTGVFLDVNIDGANAATIGMGQTYTGSLSPGKHAITVILRPNMLFLSPTQKTLTVESGQTYAFTAMWEGQNLVLR